MKRLYVSEACFDDVAAVLDTLDLPYVPLDAATELRPTESVCFLNCGSDPEISAGQLRAYVNAGGTIYASDLQAGFVAELFPSVFGAGEGFGVGSCKARILDPGLRDAIGDAFNVEFDMPGWEYLEPVPKAAGRVTTFVAAEGVPLVVSYSNAKHGSVFFTAFHNVRQESRQAGELLRFLIFRPVMSREIALAADRATTRQLRVERVQTGAVSRDYRLDTPLPAAAALAVELSWAFPARIRVTARSRSGETLRVIESGTSPVAFDLSVDASAGSLTIECLESGALENPFSLQIAVSPDVGLAVADSRRCRCGHVARSTATYCGKCGARL